MFRRLVVAVDGSENSLLALDRAIRLAATVDAPLDIVSVEEELPRYATKRDELSAARTEAERYFAGLHAQAALQAAQRGVRTVTKILIGHEVRSLLDYVRDQRADLLVLGARGHSAVWDAFLGSTADKVVAHAPASVAVVHPEAAGRTLKEIVVGVDGSPLGDRALSIALELCGLFGGAVHVVSVAEEPPGGGRGGAQQWQRYLEGVQRRALATSSAVGVPVELAVRRGHAAQALITFAEEVDADLIVIGATGYERPWSLTAGGTARRVANEAPCTVLLVRPPLPVRQVSDVMSWHVTTVESDTVLAVAIDHLIRRGIKALPVVDAERRVVGILTAGDLLQRGKLGVRLSLQGERDPAELAAELTAWGYSQETVGSLMTPHPWTITADASLEEAIHTLVRRRIKRLPVVEDGGRLVGIVSRADILRAIAAGGETTGSTLPELPRTGTVRDLPMVDVPSVAPTASAAEVLTALLGSPFRRVVVVGAERRVLGIITDRALMSRADPGAQEGLRRWLAGLVPSAGDLSHVPADAASLMEDEVFTISDQATVTDAIREFFAHRVKRLVVVDADRLLLGILDRRALLQGLVGTTPADP